jgi:hypothetical protein
MANLHARANMNLGQLILSDALRKGKKELALFLFSLSRIQKKVFDALLYFSRAGILRWLEFGSTDRTLILSRDLWSFFKFCSTKYTLQKHGTSSKVALKSLVFSIH